MNEKQAFFAVCDDAKPATSNYVSLYRNEPFYGGPEEGGWWGTDCVLVAYKECATEELADAIEAQVLALADRLSAEAKDAFNRQCAAECEWLDARGLDADFLPEVDGEFSYFVAKEDRPGSLAYESERGYC